LRLCSQDKSVNELAVDFTKNNKEEEIKMCLLCGKRQAQTVTGQFAVKSSRLC
jgi:hypothetical protein